MLFFLSWFPFIIMSCHRLTHWKNKWKREKTKTFIIILVYSPMRKRSLLGSINKSRITWLFHRTVPRKPQFYGFVMFAFAEIFFALPVCSACHLPRPSIFYTLPYSHISYPLHTLLFLLLFLLFLFFHHHHHRIPKQVTILKLFRLKRLLEKF
jgi:hypothetical protein